MALLLPSSRQVKSEISRISNFTNIAGAAMWNFRWQVRGFVQEHGNFSKPALMARFVEGSEISTIDFREILETSWEHQRNQLATVTLFSYVSLYELWQSNLEILSSAKKKQLDWPSRAFGRYDTTGNWVHTKDGASDAIAGLMPSSLLRQAFDPAVRKDERIIVGDLDLALVAYRYYKEIRNSLIHGGGLDARCMAAQAKYLTAGPLSVSRIPAKAKLTLASRTLGDEAVLTLYEVKGVIAIIMALIATVDSLIGTTAGAETILLNAIDAVLTKDKRNVIRQSKDPAARIARTVEGLGYPRPTNASALLSLVSSKGII
jgi:hypothetical protein